MKKYRVTLTAAEKTELETLIKSGKHKHTKQKRAYILLAADESEGGKSMKDSEIAKAYGVWERTVERIRQRFVEEGFEVALHGKAREVDKARVFDSRVESKLLALRCSEVPSGSNKWTLRLLADKMVELEYVERISHETVRQILKKHQSNPGG